MISRCRCTHAGRWLLPRSRAVMTAARDGRPDYRHSGGRGDRRGLLWTAPFQIPLMCAVQLTRARIGLVSGRDLRGVVREHYPRSLLWLVCAILVVANTVTAAADIDGMAAGAELLTGIPSLWFVPVFTLVMTALVVFVSYRRIAGVIQVARARPLRLRVRRRALQARPE